MKPKRTARALIFASIAALSIASCATARSADIAAEYYNLGNAYFEMAQFEKAVSYYGKALEFNPVLSGARLNMSLALVQLKRPGEAEEMLLKLLAEDPKNVTVMTALGWALHAGGKDEAALAQYDAVIRISPENRDAVYNSGLILWKLDRKSEALERFKKLLIISPEDDAALFNAGALLLSLGEDETASGYLERYLQKKPDDADALFLLAESRVGMKKYAQALSTYEKIIVLDAKEARAWFGKARLLLTVVEDPDKGLNALKQALELGFKDAEAVKVLLSEPSLQSRQEVEAVLKARNLLPKEETAE